MNAPADEKSAVHRSTPFFAVSAAPHLHGRWSVPATMLIVCAALFPALVVSAAHNGAQVLLVAAVSAAAAGAAEWAFRSIAEKRPVMLDGSACLTGLLLACTLPPQVPLRVPLLGSVFAIVIVKMAFGGRGRNFLNPALAGRAFCVLAFPAVWNAVSAPPVSVPGGTLLPLVMGYQGGWLGGSSAGALLLGAAVLWALRIIDVTLPVSFIASSFLLFWLAGEGQGALAALVQVSTGGMLLCALFMATDPATSPKTPAARFLFGTCCGALAFLFRKSGSAGDGVMYAVLLMNCIVPYGDLFCGRLRTGGRTQ